MGPVGLSGTLFLGLLVFDFYHHTNRDRYLVGRIVAKTLDFKYNNLKFHEHLPDFDQKILDFELNL